MDNRKNLWSFFEDENYNSRVDSGFDDDFDDDFDDFDDDFGDDFDDGFADDFDDGFDDDFGDGFDDDFDDYSDGFDDGFDEPVIERKPAARIRAAESKPEITEDLWGEDEKKTQTERWAFMESKTTTKILIAAAAVFCIIAAFLVPAGDVIAADNFGLMQKSASFDIEAGVELIGTNIVNDVMGLPTVYVLPMNEAPAPKPSESNYSSYTDEDGVKHSVYEDETITVDCYKDKIKDEGATVIINVAKIKIAHPTQIRSAFAGGKYSTSARYKCSEIATSANAVVAINGEFYNYGNRTYTLIRNGTVYRDDTQYYLEMLFIDSNGDFTVMNGLQAKESGFYENGEKKIYHSISFGPVLVNDGVARNYSIHEGVLMNHYRQPCSAIGQTGELEYVLVAVEGRTGESAGMKKNNLAQYMADELGCKVAYAVDGGQSSTMIFHNKPFNTISNGNNERTFSDIIYFATAIPEE